MSIDKSAYRVVDAIVEMTTTALEEMDHEHRVRLASVLDAGEYEVVVRVKFGGPVPEFDILLHGRNGTETVLSVFGKMLN